MLQERGYLSLYFTTVYTGGVEMTGAMKSALKPSDIIFTQTAARKVEMTGAMKSALKPKITYMSKLCMFTLR